MAAMSLNSESPGIDMLLIYGLTELQKSHTSRTIIIFSAVILTVELAQGLQGRI